MLLNTALKILILTGINSAQKADLNLRSSEMNDLEPFWIFENDQAEKLNYNIERQIPKYPMSREITKIDNLKRSLAVYRMDFGQAR